MILLVIAPVLMIVAWLIGIIVSLGDSSKGRDIQYPKMPDGEEYKNIRYPKTDYPDISDQLDDRLTNIVRNPFDGIL